MLLALLIGGCDPEDKPPSDDPHVQPNEGNYEENREHISPPTLLYPIYKCASNVAVKHFIKGAELEVSVTGEAMPIGSAIGQFPSIGENIEVSISFVEGQVVTATQTVDGITSSPSNAVTVTSHLEDYPDACPSLA